MKSSSDISALPHKTNYKFKILYALGILFVVMGHSKGGGVHIFTEFIPLYAFHLALFVFASGYFYSTRYEQTPFEFVKKKFKRLIIPLYLWNFFYGLIAHFLRHKFSFIGTVNFKSLFWLPVINGHQFCFNLAGWFIIPLFMLHIFNVYFRKIFFFYKLKYQEFIYFIFCLILGFVGIFLAEKGIAKNNSSGLVLTRFLYFVPFYSFGILYRKYEKFDKLRNLYYFLIIIIAELFIIYTHNGPLYYVQSWSDYQNGFFLPIFTAFLGLGFWYRVSKILEPAIGKNSLINYVANNTYTIMINHFFGFFILKTIFALTHEYTNYCSGFNIAAYESNLWYYYLPHNLNQFLILYVIFGFAFSLLLQKLIDYIKSLKTKAWTFLPSFKLKSFVK